MVDRPGSRHGFRSWLPTRRELRTTECVGAPGRDDNAVTGRARLALPGDPLGQRSLPCSHGQEAERAERTGGRALTAGVCTDSGAQLPGDLAARLGIGVVPLTVRVAEQ